MASFGVLSSSSPICEANQFPRNSWTAGSQALLATSRRCRCTAASRKATTASHTALPHSRAQQHGGHAERQYSFSGLASYRFRTQDIPCRWLEACVREAVAHIDEAPFLQVTHTPGPSAQPSFDRTVLPGISTITSQIWQDITQHLAGRRDAETVLYLAPLHPSPASSSSSRPVPRRRSLEVLTGITATPVLRGHVGDHHCCDDHEQAAGNNASPTQRTEQQPAHSPQSQIVPLLRPERRWTGGSVRPPRATLPADAEWGVVVQSQWHEALNGCYILRTSSSREPDCQCTHFSLVRAHEGHGVSEQMLSAWLA